MPRTMRVEYAGASYHVMDRGDRREDIFVDDVDRQDSHANVHLQKPEADATPFDTMLENTDVPAFAHRRSSIPPLSR